MDGAPPDHNPKVSPVCPLRSAAGGQVRPSQGGQGAARLVSFLESAVGALQLTIAVASLLAVRRRALVTAAHDWWRRCFHCRALCR